MVFRQLLALVLFSWLSMGSLEAMQQPSLPPFFHDSIMTKFHKKIKKKVASVDLKQYNLDELVQRSRELKDSNPDLAESLLCAFTNIVNYQHGFEQLGIFYESLQRYHEAAKAFCSAQSAYAFHRLGDIFANYLLDENRAAQAYLMASLNGNSSFASYARLFEEKLSCVKGESVVQYYSANAILGYCLALHQQNQPSYCHLVELLYDQLNTRHVKIDLNLYKFVLLQHKAVACRLHCIPDSWQHSVDAESLDGELKKVDKQKPALSSYESLLQAAFTQVGEQRCYDDAMIERAKHGDASAYFALASDIYQRSMPQQSGEIARCYLMAMMGADNALRKTIIEKLREQARGKKYDVVGELFLMSLEHQRNDIANDVLAALQNRNYLVEPQCAAYLINQQRERFGAFVYGQADSIALELFMRILEMASKTNYYLPFNNWCKRYHREEQPAHDTGNRYFLPLSPVWYHLQRLRMQTYLGAHQHKIDVKKRLIEFAQTIGVGCCEKDDYNAAVPFLFPAAQLGDPISRELLTNLCLANPSYIAPEQGWMDAAADKCIKEHGEHARVIKLYILMGQGPAGREQAFQLFSTLLNDEQEARYAAISLSNPLDDRIAQLAEHGDVAAIKIFALQSLIVHENIQKAYSLIQSIADRSNPWITYLYTALAEQLSDAACHIDSLALSYHNLWYSGDPIIRFKAEEALHRYAAEGSETAQQLLAMIEAGSSNIDQFVKLTEKLSDDGIRQHFFDWYVDVVLNQSPHELCDAPSSAAQRFYVQALQAASGLGWCSSHDLIKTCRTFGRFHYDAMNDARAVSFLIPAAVQQDRKSQTMLATLIAQNPCLITPTVTFIRPLIESVGQENQAKVDLATIYLLLCGTSDEREEGFKKITERMANQSINEVITGMPDAVRDHGARLVREGDCFALLTAALLAIATEKVYEILPAVMTLPHNDNPWIIFIQSRKAEFDAPHDAAITSHVFGYNKLLHCGISYLEHQAEEGLMRCIKNKDVVAQALLFCDSVEHKDRRSAIAVFVASKVEKPFYDYLNTNCFDRLVKASGRNAFAAFILGNLYEQRAAANKDSVSQFIENLRLAFESYAQANSAGHPCSSKLLPIAFYLAAHYRQENRESDVKRIEAIVDRCDATEREKGLTSLLESNRVQENHIDYLMSQLERLAKTNDQLAAEIADWYIQGKEFKNGYKIVADGKKALPLLKAAAKHSDKARLAYASLVLRHADISAPGISKAIAYLETVKNVDPETECRLKELKQQQQQRERESDLDVVQKTTDLDVLREAVNRLEKIALKEDFAALKVVGLALMRMALTAKNSRDLMQRAAVLLERYNLRYPDDKEVRYALIHALYYRSAHQANDNQKAYDLLKQYENLQEAMVTPADTELFGILAFKNHDYTKALSLFGQCQSLSTSSAWYGVVSYCHNQHQIKDERNTLIKYFTKALSLSENSLDIKASELDEVDYVIKFLLEWSDPSAVCWLARLSLISKNNKGLNNYIGNKLLFGKNLLVAAAHDRSSFNLVLFAFRNKWWGIDTTCIETIIDIGDRSVRKSIDKLYNLFEPVSALNYKWVIHQELLRECSRLARALYPVNRTKLQVEQLPLLIWASCEAGVCKILENQSEVRREGLDILITTTEYLTVSPLLTTIRPRFQKTFHHDALARSIFHSANHNTFALMALILCFSLDLLSKEVLPYMKLYVAQFIESFIKGSPDKIADLEKKDYELAARVCAHVGHHMRNHKAPLSEYKACFERALVLNPRDDEALWGLGWAYVHHGDAKGVQQGFQILKQVVDHRPTAATCFGLGLLYVTGNADGGVKIPLNSRLGLPYLEQAASLGHGVAQKIVESRARYDEYCKTRVPAHTKQIDAAVAAEKIRLAEDLLAKKKIDEALELAEKIMNQHKNICTAMFAASLYIESEIDLERGVFCLLRALECFKEPMVDGSFFVERFLELCDELRNKVPRSFLFQFWLFYIREQRLELLKLFNQ